MRYQSWFLVCALLAGPSAINEGGGPQMALAKQPVRTYRITMACGCTEQTAKLERDRLAAELSIRGYQQGKNVDLDLFFLDAHSPSAEQVRKYWNDIVSTKPDLIVAPDQNTAALAKQRKIDTPVLFYGLADPIQLGLIESLQKPGGNLTGFASSAEQLTIKRLSLLHEMVPSARRIGFIYRPDVPMQKRQFAEVLATASRLKLQAIPFPPAMGKVIVDDIDDIFARMKRERVDAFLLAAGTGNSKRLVELAARNRLPTIYPSIDAATDLGGLASYSAETTDYSAIADYAVRLLNGAKPSDLPIQEPTKLDIVLNLKAAKDLGLTFPSSLLLVATKVVGK